MQVLKDTVKNDINQSALICFSENGFFGTSMKDIAKAAKISVGNIYKYYKNKKDLFYSLVTGDLILKIRKIISEKIELMSGINIPDLISQNDYIEYNEKLKRFLAQNRLEIIIIIDKSENTKFEKFKEEFTGFLVTLCIDYIKTIKKENIKEFIKNKASILRIFYSNLLTGLVKILRAFKKEEDIKNEFETLLTYHLNGIKSIL